MQTIERRVSIKWALNFGVNRFYRNYIEKQHDILERNTCIIQNRKIKINDAITHIMKKQISVLVIIALWISGRTCKTSFQAVGPTLFDAIRFVRSSTTKIRFSIFLDIFGIANQRPTPKKWQQSKCVGRCFGSRINAKFNDRILFQIKKLRFS